jgi:alpha-L-fucosidase
MISQAVSRCPRFTACRAACFALLFCATVIAPIAQAQTLPDPTVGSLNKPERLQWFGDQGFGIFIHWSVDSQLGSIISHSLVDASPEYVNKFYNELPKTFDPTRFDPDAIARMVRLSGAKYVVFTTKHHSGFAMWDTKTNDFNIMHTPFHRDITRELYTSLRKQGIAVGVYYSPDDFYWLHKHDITINRYVPDVQFSANPGLLKYDQDQVTELMKNYGPIDIAYFDGDPRGLRDIAWKLQPNVVVTRGGIETPEQSIPGQSLPSPWEASMTMSTAWQYQPQHDVYKSGLDILHLLIQTRARGGNLLLDIGPKPDGEIPIEQQERLQEVGMWMFINSDAIYGTKPWNITNENDIWFTQVPDKDANGHPLKTSTLYAIIDRQWRRGTWIDLALQSVRATADSKVDVLGQASKVFEYQQHADPTPTLTQKEDGLHIHAMRTQRLTDSTSFAAWPNPAVIRITHVEQAFLPPTVHTLAAVAGESGKVKLQGEWANPGTAAKVQVGFEYRSITGEDTNSRTSRWMALPLTESSTPGEFSAETSALQPGTQYEIRTVVKHPLLTLYGDLVRYPAR